jgi:hypothetical protein
MLLVLILAGCGGGAVGDSTQALASCPASPTQLIAAFQGCPGHTIDGIPCHICRDYVGCVIGRGEGVDYCTNARDNCADPVCQY